jgi:outer membrane protein TolC
LAERLQRNLATGLGLLAVLVLLTPGPAPAVEALEVPPGQLATSLTGEPEAGTAPDGIHPVYKLRVEPLGDGEALVLTLEEVLELAATSNFGLRRQDLTIEKGHYSVDQTYYAFDPSLNANFGYSRRASGGASAQAGGGLSGSESYSLGFGATVPREYGDSFSFDYGLSRASYSIIGSDSEFEIPTTYNADFGLSYSRPLARGAGKYVNRIPRFIASNNLQLSYDQLDDQVRRLKRDVMNTFFQAVAARESIDVRQSSLERALQQLERAVERYKVGLAIRADVLQAENSVLGQRSQLLTAQSGYDALLDNLATLTGVPAEIEVTVDPELSLIDVGSDELPADLWTMVEQNSYELKSLNTQRANLLLTRDQQADRLRPQLGLSLNYSRSGEDDTLDAAATGYENESYSVNLNWSATPGERGTRAGLAQTELDLASLDLSIQETELALKTALRNLQRDLATRRQQVVLSEDNLAVLEENYNIMYERNQVGLATTLDVVEAQQSLLEGELALLNARVAYQESYRELLLMAGLI